MLLSIHLLDLCYEIAKKYALGNYLKFTFDRLLKNNIKSQYFILFCLFWLISNSIFCCFFFNPQNYDMKFTKFLSMWPSVIVLLIHYILFVKFVRYLNLHNDIYRRILCILILNVLISILYEICVKQNSVFQLSFC